MYSVDSKMDMLRIIDILNANSKVGEVFIQLSNKNKLNSEILTSITNRCTNVHTIDLYNHND